MARRHTRRYVTVDVDVELSVFDVSDLIEHMKECGYAVIKGNEGFDLDDLGRVYEAVQDNRRADALALLERIIRPKWNTPAKCQAALEEALGRKVA